MPFEIRLEYTIHADKEFIFDWWTDLSPDDTRLAKPLESRKIISRSPTDIVLEDEEVIFGRKMAYNVRVTLNKPLFSWVAEYDGKDAKARSEYRLVSEGPNGNTTRLLYHSTVLTKGFLTNLFSPIVRYFVKRVFRREIEEFSMAIEKEYGTNRHSNCQNTTRERRSTSF